MSAPHAIVLVGPRGAGKTTVGRALAARLRLPFRDGDELLAAAAGMPAGDYLARAGEKTFRQLEERTTLAALADEGRSVLALGGGAVLSAAVRQALRAAGCFTVFLCAPAAVLARRVAGAPVRRPPLTDLPPAEEAAAVLAARLPLYAQVARTTVDTGGADVGAVVEQVLAALPAGGGAAGPGADSRRECR